jgi:hypothetical protein
MKTTETYYVLRLNRTHRDEIKGEYSAEAVRGDIFAEEYRSWTERYSEPHVEAEDVRRFSTLQCAAMSAEPHHDIIEVIETTVVSRRKRKVRARAS